MNTESIVHTVPALAVTTGQWRAVYWEPVMLTGERICVGFLTVWEGRATAELTLRPDLLEALFGAGGHRAQALLDRAFRIMGAGVAAKPALADVAPPLTGLYFGSVETSHVNSYTELLQVAKLMSSSLSTLAEPDNAEAADVIEMRPEQSQPARQFARRVQDLAVARNVKLAGCFQREATLMSKRRFTRFGFLSDSLAAHFGLLQPTNITRHVRMVRGLITELSLAERASGRSGLLILGFQSLSSPTLTDKERSAIEDYTEELGLEAKEFNVAFAAADNDQGACDALMNAL